MAGVERLLVEKRDLDAAARSGGARSYEEVEAEAALEVWRDFDLSACLASISRQRQVKLRKRGLAVPPQNRKARPVTPENLVARRPDCLF